jgi:SAM-dependent methyltransferase
VRTLADVSRVEQFAAVYERAYGPDVWVRVAGKQVLDLGCGEGGHVLALAAGGAAHVTGLDILPDFDNARQVAQARGYAATFIGGDTTTLPDAAFDVVFSHDSFEHFAEPGRILAEMTRLARPGGHLMIKFGPPWRNPWGRHMGGTLRRDRPWVHLVVPERVMMRVHSVYHDDPVLVERVADLPGGMNKMTVGRFRRLLREQPGIRVEQFDVFPLFGARALTALPLTREFFASGVRAICVRL